MNEILWKLKKIQNKPSLIYDNNFIDFGMVFLLLADFSKKYDPKGFRNSLQKSIGKKEIWKCSGKQS